jgi:N-methylhydantoinase A/oxoprolinase/acetone carboxylase beta subunit
VLALAIDVGGTFTDVVGIDLETLELRAAKVLGDGRAPAAAIRTGIDRVLAAFEAGPADVSLAIHGTTLVSNALLERTGARTGLLTTEGFRDVLQTRTEKRYDLYDFNAVLPEPLIPRHLRLGVRERIDATGEVVTELDEEAARAAIDRLRGENVAAVAVCFLHSYRNPVHEQRVAALVRELAPGVALSVSSEIAPQIREYPRVSTTAANAYVQPLVAAHIDATSRLFDELGYDRTFYMMVSGAVIDPATARRTPIRLVDSGAAAGAAAAATYGAVLNQPDVISFEMGGTSAKFCVIRAGRPSMTNAFEAARVDQSRPGSGLAIALPGTDLAEIGSGGGSIAWVDELGLLRVGPRSAGSLPGPACYGRGGELPTVTDANLVLGYLNPDFFLGGEMALRADLARASVEALATRVGMGVAETAWGVHRLVTENMLSAARQHVTERGHDPRRFPLMAFGGAGPAHAVRFARGLGCGRVIVPQGAGVTSAVGMLSAPFGFDFVRTYLARLAAIDLERLNAMLDDMERQGVELLQAAGFDRERVRITRTCEMRYAGQTHEIPVEIPGGRLDEAALEEVRQRYAEQYERLFLHPALPYELECANWRVFAAGLRPPLVPAWSSRAGRGARPDGRREAWSARAGGFVPWDVHDRAALRPGDRLDGPAIVEEPETTTILPEDSWAVVDERLNLLVAP